MLSTEEFSRFLPRLDIDWPDWLDTLDPETFCRGNDLALYLKKSVQRVCPL